MFSGLTAQGVPASAATPISHLPPIGVLFAAFLGYNPMQQLLGPLLSHLSPAHAAYVVGREFFPHLITGPFHDGIGVAFGFAIACLRDRRRRLGADRPHPGRTRRDTSLWAPNWPPWPRTAAESSPASWSSPTWSKVRRNSREQHRYRRIRTLSAVCGTSRKARGAELPRPATGGILRMRSG